MCAGVVRAVLCGIHDAEHGQQEKKQASEASDVFRRSS